MLLSQIFLGITFSTVGAVLLGVAVILVHSRVEKEHSIDDEVVAEIRRERMFAMIGILLIVVGYALEVATLFEVSIFGLTL